MKQIELAEKLGVCAQHVSDMKRGASEITRKMADKMEQVTGISALQWLYPKKYGDPWDILKDLPSP